MACIMACVPTTEERLTIDVPGAGPVSAVVTRPAEAFASLALFHGAGAGMDHPFMAGFARAIAEEGVATLRCNFPYMEAGKRSPDREPVAVATVRAAFAAAIERAGDGEPVWVGGKSFGGRMASVAVAEGLPAAGLVFLGYPFHPPGKPDRGPRRAPVRHRVPMLFVQGTKDPFATPAGPRTRCVAKLRPPRCIASRGRTLARAVARRRRPRGRGSFAPLVAAFMRGDRA